LKTFYYEAKYSLGLLYARRATGFSLVKPARHREPLRRGGRVDQEKNLSVFFRVSLWLITIKLVCVRLRLILFFINEGLEPELEVEEAPEAASEGVFIVN